MITGIIAIAVLIPTGFYMNVNNYSVFAQSVVWIAGILIMGNTGVHWAQALQNRGVKRHDE